MRHAKTIILVMLFIALLNCNLFSRISSWVSGTVREVDTNIPLKDVTVYLVEYDKDDPIINENDRRRRVRTDEAGKFRIDDIDKGTYFVTCEKIGYAALNPLYLARENNPEDFLPIFFIDEGQIKHFKFTMKKGGSITISVQKKDEDGISDISEVNCYLSMKSKSIDLETGDHYSLIVSSMFTNSQGETQFNYLTLNLEYEISIEKQGLPSREINVVIPTTQPLKKRFLFDFLSSTSIRGRILFKDKKPSIILLSLRQILEKNYKFITDSSTNNGNFFFPDLNPGKYLLRIAVTFEGDENIHRKKVFVDVKDGEVSQLEISI